MIGGVGEGDELLLWSVRCWWWWWWWWWLLWTLGSTLTTSSTRFLESWWLRNADCSKFRPRGIIPPPLRAAAVGVVDPNCSIPTSVATALPYPTGASGTAKICSKKSSPNPSELLLPAMSRTTERVSRITKPPLSYSGICGLKNTESGKQGRLLPCFVAVCENGGWSEARWPGNRIWVTVSENVLRLCLLLWNLRSEERKKNKRKRVRGLDLAEVCFGWVFKFESRSFSAFASCECFWPRTE